MCSELTPRARIPDIRIPQLMQPCPEQTLLTQLGLRTYTIQLDTCITLWIHASWTHMRLKGAKDEVKEARRAP